MAENARNENVPQGLHEAALEALPTAIMIHDHHYVLYVNRAALSMLGAIEHEQVVGRPVSDIVHPDGAEAGMTRRRIVLESGHAVTDVPVKLIGVDGIVRYATVTGQAVMLGDTKVIVVTAVLTRMGSSKGATTRA